jgi:hypothetical protein
VEYEYNKYGLELIGSPNVPIEDGQGFQIIAVLVKQSSLGELPQHVESLGYLKKVKGVHIISEIRTAIFRTHQ